MLVLTSTIPSIYLLRSLNPTENKSFELPEEVLATNFRCSEHVSADKNTMKLMLETLNRSWCTLYSI
jgi:hypothetical protein